MDQFARIIEERFPFHQLLGIKADLVEEGRVQLHIPYKEALLGDKDSKRIHGGVISSLMDICGGFAVWTRCKPQDRLVTITLNVDYLHSAMASDLYAEAKVRMLGNRVGNAHVVVWTAENPTVHVAEGRGVYNIRRTK
ncbi:PaaI family thioesterase [Oceanidesulfovibrio marinus]|uniref:PaaI family thioesterase n=1 Tax=Oceanidesulfovibrio marinus TaxID=370038 RepID=A0ABX6NHW2_9BACT|nr:PaaI family thioesterase [Oceanidesulfovibrio marinus]QJT09846.1 PaaI family thioesterase [Oceanidesulfovibrio marinus]